MPQKKRVLYVEDNKDTSFLGGFILERSGFEVVSARDFSEGLMLAAKYRFDVYLLDAMLPDGSGIDLCRRIRESDPDTPVVFFSARGYGRDKDQAFAAGAQAYVSKPATPEELVGAINGVLGISESDTSSD
jgi:DNA-binding response OmpR family regulator